MSTFRGNFLGNKEIELSSIISVDEARHQSETHTPQLHFPTVFTHTDLLIQLIDFPKSIDMKEFHELKLKIIDLTYIHHQEIFHKLFYYSTGRWEKTNQERKEFLTTECNNLFLASAVIVTTTTFVQSDRNTSSSLSNQTALALDKLTDIPSDDIIALGSIITMMILN